MTAGFTPPVAACNSYEHLYLSMRLDNISQGELFQAQSPLNSGWTEFKATMLENAITTVFVETGSVFRRVWADNPVHSVPVQTQAQDLTNALAQA